jgi:hypothetical protein
MRRMAADSNLFDSTANAGALQRTEGTAIRRMADGVAARSRLHDSRALRVPRQGNAATAPP